MLNLILIPDDENRGITKHYYLSQSIKYTWIGSYLFCRSNGMKLAKISDTNAEFKNFRSLVNNSETLNSFYFDLDVSFVGLSSPKCYFFDRTAANNPIQKIACDATKKDFLCEAIQEEEKMSIIKRDTNSAVHEKFFNYFGDLRK